MGGVNLGREVLGDWLETGRRKSLVEFIEFERDNSD